MLNVRFFALRACEEAVFGWIKLECILHKSVRGHDPDCGSFIRFFVSYVMDRLLEVDVSYCYLTWLALWRAGRILVCGLLSVCGAIADKFWLTMCSCIQLAFDCCVCFSDSPPLSHEGWTCFGSKQFVWIISFSFRWAGLSQNVRVWTKAFNEAIGMVRI